MFEAFTCARFDVSSSELIPQETGSATGGNLLLSLLEAAESYEQHGENLQAIAAAISGWEAAKACRHAGWRLRFCQLLTRLHQRRGHDIAARQFEQLAIQAALDSSDEQSSLPPAIVSGVLRDSAAEIRERESAANSVSERICLSCCRGRKWRLATQLLTRSARAAFLRGARRQGERLRRLAGRLGRAERLLDSRQTLGN